MAMYYEGYSEAKEQIRQMDEDDLYPYIDGLYGRDDLPENCTLEELRAEALRQCRLDYTDTTSQEFDQLTFYKALLHSTK